MMLFSYLFMPPTLHGAYYKVNMMYEMSVFNERGEILLQSRASYSLEWIYN